jgi:hypothetical protein
MDGLKKEVFLNRLFLNSLFYKWTFYNWTFCGCTMLADGGNQIPVKQFSRASPHPVFVYLSVCGKNTAREPLIITEKTRQVNNNCMHWK